MTDLATDITQSTPPKAKNRLIGVVKAVLLIAVFVLVGYALWQQWKKIDWQTVTIRPLPIALAVLALVGVSTVQMISYRTLLAAYATAPAWRQMLAVAWVPPLGKYVPGKVAALMAAMSMLRRFGIPAAVAVSVVLVLDGLAVVAGLITGAPLLLWEPIRKIAPWAWAVCVPVTVAGVVCLWPSIFARLINFLLQRLKKQPLPKMPPLADYIIPVMCAFAQWLLAGLALLWIVASVTGQTRWHDLPLLISFAALSQTLGYLALFAPGGIGPREAILLAGLIPLVGPLAAVVVPIRAVMQIGVDVALALVGLRLLRAGAASGSSPSGGGTRRATSQVVTRPLCSRGPPRRRVRCRPRDARAPTRRPSSAGPPGGFRPAGSRPSCACCCKCGDGRGRAFPR